MIGVKRFEKNGGNPAKLSQEAKQLAKLDHPNIVRYFYNFETRNSHGKAFAIVMELLTEGSFADRIRKKPSRSSSRAGSSAASALARTRSRCYTETSSRTTYCSTLSLARTLESKYRGSTKSRRHATVHEPGEGRGDDYDAKDDVWAVAVCVHANGGHGPEHARHLCSQSKWRRSALSKAKAVAAVGSRKSHAGAGRNRLSAQQVVDQQPQGNDTRSVSRPHRSRAGRS